MLYERPNQRSRPRGFSARIVLPLILQSFQFSDDVSLFILDDVGIVFSESAQEIYELNTPATWIWCQLEEDVEESALLDAFQTMFDFDRVVAREHVLRTLQDWRDLGFFDRKGGPPPRRKPRATPKKAGIKSRMRRYFERASMDLSKEEVRRYRVFGKLTSVIYPSEEIENLIHPGLVHLEVTEPSTEKGIREIRISVSRTGYQITTNGNETISCNAVNQLAPIIQYKVIIDSALLRDFSVAFHAGAVAEGAIFIEGLPFSICVKETGIAFLQKYFPEIADLPAHQRFDGKTVRYLPPLTYLGSGDAGEKAAWLVFPHHESETETSINEIPRHDALKRLLKTSALRLPLLKEQIQTLIRWIRSVDCYEFKIASLDEGVALVDELFEAKGVCKK